MSMRGHFGGSTIFGIAFLVSGCLSSQPPALSAAVPPLLRDPHPSCDANRTIVAHHADAAPATSALSDSWRPCFSRTGAISREPTIGISSTGTVFHYPALPKRDVRPYGVAASTDGAESWRLIFPNAAGAPTHPTSLDPYFYLDPATDRIFADDLIGLHCSIFSWSDDEGGTWDHSYSGCLETDHQTIFAGIPVHSQTLGYPNLVYRCASNLVAGAGASSISTCQKSLDGGRTWLPPGAPAYVSPLPRRCSGAVGHGITDEDGRILLPKGHCNQPTLAISDDEGDSWRLSQVADTGSPDHETGVGIDPDGNIYYVWNADDGLPYLSVSRDDARTWSPPMMVGPPGLVNSTLVELAVGGVGKFALVYLGTYDQDDDPQRAYHGFLTLAFDALDADPTFYTATVNDPIADPLLVGACCGGIQDFLDVRIGPDGTAWGAYVDDCLGEGKNCLTATEAVDSLRDGAVGWFQGAPSLWDPSDPDGHYPDKGEPAP